MEINGSNPKQKPPFPPKPGANKPPRMTGNFAWTLEDMKDKYVAVNYIYLDQPSGTLTEKELESVKNSKNTVFVLDDAIYRLESIDGDIQVYVNVSATADDSISSDICVNLTSGAYEYRYVQLNHQGLSHLDYLSSGHTGFAGIEFNTTAGWNSQPQYRPVEGMLVVYTDYKTITDPDTGETTVVPGFKIGDGNAYLIDKPFVGDDIRAELEALSSNFDDHIQNDIIHITAVEREFWNNKLNYVDPEDQPEDKDLLEFTRN